MPTTTRAINVIHAINELRDTLKRNVTIVETGSMRNTTVSATLDYRRGDGWSTFYIARYCMLNPGNVFYSIDLDTSIARAFLQKHGLIGGKDDYCYFYEGDSRVVLAELLKHGVRPDIVYLDSANDADLILAEFKLVEPYAKIIIVDDVDPANTELQKGLKVLPYIENKYLYKQLERQLKVWLQ